MRRARRDPIAVLLLPRALEEMQPGPREQARALLSVPGVVALEPGMLPPVRSRRFVTRQARRLMNRLPGRPVVVVLFDAARAPLALAFADRDDAVKLWRTEHVELEGEVAARVGLTVVRDDPQVWERLRALGVATDDGGE